MGSDTKKARYQIRIEDHSTNQPRDVSDLYPDETSKTYTTPQKASEAATDLRKSLKRQSKSLVPVPYRVES